MYFAKNFSGFDGIIEKYSLNTCSRTRTHSAKLRVIIAAKMGKLQFDFKMC